MTALFRITILMLLMLVGAAAAQQPNTPGRNNEQSPIPSVDGDVGSCSLRVTVLNGQGKPVGSANVVLNATYGGLFSRHELDLEGYTNKDGKAQFIGLPEKTDGVAYVTASSDTLKGVAVYDPQNACDNEHTIIVAPARPAQQSSGAEQ